MKFRRVLALVGSLVFLGAISACTTTNGPGDISVSPQQAASAVAPSSPAMERAKVHTELGSLYMHEGRYAVALEEGKIALAADASYAPAYNLLALTNMALGDMRLAGDYFERALRLASGDPEISNNYGWFLCQTGKEKQSIEYFLRAARNQLYVTPTKAYTNLGICQSRINDYAGAESNLMVALRLAPNNTLAIYWLSQIAYRQNHLPEAKQWILELERQIELTSEATWLALRIERKLGNREAEARYSAQLRRRFSGTPELQKLLRGDFE